MQSTTAAHKGRAEARKRSGRAKTPAASEQAAGPVPDQLSPALEKERQAQLERNEKRYLRMENSVWNVINMASATT